MKYKILYHWVTPELVKGILVDEYCTPKQVWTSSDLNFLKHDLTKHLKCSYEIIEEINLMDIDKERLCVWALNLLNKEIG